MSAPNDNQQPATKGDIADLRNDLGTLRDDLIEAMRDMQTEVVRAFHTWARPIEIRLPSFDDMQQRLGLLEERVSAIERGDKPAA
jgi:hypothetical protein